MRYAIALFFLSLSCLPSEDEIVDQCKVAADSAIQECEDYYRYTVLPEILSIIKQVCVE